MLTWILWALAAAATAALLGFEHYFAWHRILGHDPEAPWSYVAGVATLGVGFTVWVLVTCPVRPLAAWEVIAGWWGIVAAGGVTIIGCYQVDGWLGRRATKAATRVKNAEAGRDCDD